MTQNLNLEALAKAGVSIWLDDLSRDLIASGTLADLIDTSSVVGVTTNPSIFQAALSKGSAYDKQIDDLASQGADVDTAIRTITTDDVRAACDVFETVFSATSGVDGRVSIEVDPRIAHDTAKTVAQAVELYELVDRPNVLIKIPATEAGIPAIAAVIGKGISVNVTLVFSVERYELVMGAYLDGLETAIAAGHDPNSIHSVASFFISRVDSEVDDRLEAIGTPDAIALKSKAARANARLAYRAYQRVFEVGSRFQDLSRRGARPQRPLWASTGVKDAGLPDTLYVTGLVAPNTVNTMPDKTMRAVADHGVVDGDTITGTGEQAQLVFDRIAELGIDLTDVFLTLENEGVRKFEASWAELFGTTEDQLAAANEQ